MGKKALKGVIDQRCIWLDRRQEENLQPLLINHPIKLSISENLQPLLINHPIKLSISNE